jgi:dephospho-CoA kinase
MIIVGLTGGIASGKNFVAEVFAKNGAAIFDADKEVHELLESDKSTFSAVKKNFPQAIIDKKIERKILGKIVFADEKKLKILEKILHPKVRKKYQEFLIKARKEKKKFAVLNIPLLLETKGYKCDYVIAIITKKSEQKKRFLDRALKQNLAANKIELTKRFIQITKKQLSNSARKKAADFVIENLSKAQTTKLVKDWISKV